MEVKDTEYLTFIHTPQYVVAAKGLVDDEFQRRIETAIMENPDGTPVQAGVRKIRVAREGMGKSGGVRVIYFYISERSKVYLIDVYAKNKKESLSGKEKEAVRKLAQRFTEEK